MTVRVWRSEGTLAAAVGWLRAPWNWAARPVGSNYERTIYVLLFALLIAVRVPRILLEGRFWAEEGSIFFANAWKLPWRDALLLPYAGYLNLVANFAGILARYLPPLWAAPYASTGLALLIQCTPAILIVSSGLDWLRSRAVLVAALLIVAIPPLSQEVLLSSIHGQFHLALAAAIVLVAKPSAGPVGLLQGLVLLIAPLSGPAAWVLAPLFALRAVIDRSWPGAAQGLILCTGLIVQLTFFVVEVPQRIIGAPPSLLGAIVLVKHVIAPFVPLPLISPGYFLSGFDEAGGPIWPLILVIILFAAAVGAAILHPREAPIWLLLSGALMAGSGYVGGLGSKLDLLQVLQGGRYAFVPQVLFGLALLCWSVIHSGNGRFLARAAVVWLLAVGITDYFKQPQIQGGPPWRAEVLKWQQNPRYNLQIWPPGWSVTLPAKGRQ